MILVLYSYDSTRVFIIFARNAYVRFAPGLLKDGIQLLHWLTIIAISTIITHGFFIWHVKAWWKGTYFESTVKFKMCTRDMDESVSRKGLKICRKSESLIKVTELDKNLSFEPSKQFPDQVYNF